MVHERGVALTGWIRVHAAVWTWLVLCLSCLLFPHHAVAAGVPLMSIDRVASVADRPGAAFDVKATVALPDDWNDSHLA